MKMSEYLKKKKLFFIITTLIIILIIIVSICVYNKKNKESLNVQEQDLSVTYNINKEEIPPMDKINGATNVPLSTIKIKNNKNYKQKYQLIINPDDKSTLGINKVYILLDNEVKTLADFNNGIVYTDTINANEEKIISFKTWIASDLIDEYDKDKIISLKYDIKKQD